MDGAEDVDVHDASCVLSGALSNKKRPNEFVTQRACMGGSRERPANQHLCCSGLTYQSVEKGHWNETLC
jgi:hypothetical protein